MILRKIGATLGAVAAVVMVAGFSVGQAASAAVGPYDLVSAASSANGIQVSGGVVTDGTTFTSITIGGNGGGYQEFVASDGTCLTWDAASAAIDAQACTGATTQLWAGTGSKPDLIWNEWFDSTYHERCTWGSGYTQSVITAPVLGGGLTLSCPGGNGYNANQQWFVSTPAAPPPADPGAAPAELAYPTGTCGQAGSQGAGNCIPVTDYGSQLANLTGAQMVASWDPTQTELDACASSTCTIEPVTADQYGNAVLYTNGQARDESSLASANMAGVGLSQTYGIFEAEVYLPGSNGKIDNFPAFWLSGVGNTWPVGGEIDFFEGLGGNARSTYHGEVNPGTVNGAVTTVAGTPKSLTVPGWHDIVGVWEQEYMAVYIDGVHTFDYYNAQVEGTAPLQVIINNATGQGTAGYASGASTMYVGWFRDYTWSGQ